MAGRAAGGRPAQTGALAAWFRWEGNDLVLELRVQPRAGINQVCGPSGGRLKVRIAAPPVEDAANRQLLKWLAAEFRAPVSSLSLASGARGRDKRVVIPSPGALPAWFKDLSTLAEPSERAP